MPLSSPEQSKIVQLLGYPTKTIQAGSVVYNRVVNDRLNQLQPATEDLVRGYLAGIAALECQIGGAPSRLAAAAVGDLKMNLEELQMLRNERKKQIRELGAMLDIPYKAVNGPNSSVVA